jgi:ferredoxin
MKGPITMTIKDVCAVYFSPTGTTRRVVECIAAELAAQLSVPARTVDFTLPQDRQTPLIFDSQSLIVFGTPVIAGRVPNVLLKFLATLQGRGALAIPVVAFGNRDFDDALIELRDILADGGCRPFAAAAFVGEHSFSRTLAAGRPDEEDLALARRFADDAAKSLAENPNPGLIAVTGTPKPYRGYYKPRDRQGNFINILKVVPKTRDTCTQCGHCAAICPMGSIDPDDCTRLTGICIKCGACVKGCPVDAKYYDDEGYLYHQRELELGYARRAEPAAFIQEPNTVL